MGHVRADRRTRLARTARPLRIVAYNHVDSSLAIDRQHSILPNEVATRTAVKSIGTLEMTRRALLVAERSAGSPSVARSLVETEYVLEDVPSVEGACQSLRADGPDLVICCGDAAQIARACRAVRAERLSRYIYIIAVLGRPDAASVVEVLENGADDCLCEPIENAEFAARLSVAERILDRDRELSYLLRCDPLTKLLNRRSLFEFLEKELSRADRYGFALSCAMLDVDDFKDINDTRGHLAGDAVLSAVARTLEQSLRRSELVCRFGGDEFCVLMPQTDLAGAEVSANRCLEAIQNLRVDWKGEPLTISMSIGIAQRCPTADSVETFLNRADEALLIAKRTGKSRVCTR